jgi:decaprenylphospho-beta-D-ribofuranose 2-oxidase
LNSSTKLSGWGRTAWSDTHLLSVDYDELAIGLTDREPMIAHGLGRSYGDCAVIAGGRTINSDTWLGMSMENDVLTAGSGVTLESIMKHWLPHGWFVPVTPGTRFVTVGGAIASDIHGKNHHKDGTFGSHVMQLDLLVANGDVLTISPKVEPEIFWATVGGMGLTGVIISAKIRMIQVETSRMRTVTSRFANVHDLMSAMIVSDRDNKYSVAWIDMLAKGKNLGRAVLSNGDHALISDLSRRDRKTPLDYVPKQRIHSPKWFPNGLLNNLTVRLFNELWFRKSPRQSKSAIQTVSKFFHPLDGIEGWNRMYGSAGFIQYQFVVPDSAAHLIPEIIEMFVRAKCPVFLSVLKRFGDQNSGLLSFPLKGWTLAVDVSASFHGLSELLDEMDSHVVESGGRIYLSKDSRMNPYYLGTMYPRLNEFLAVKNRIDPDHLFTSNLSLRLGL